ncbi:MAG TPA: hypothetical protein VM285_15500, partial [Polyangia bacterium]|nr:hypothetical protein [Polyangia bacterium]
MARTDDTLVQKGVSQPRVGLLDQGIVHAELGRRNAEKLAEHGWTPADTEEIEELTRELGMSITAQHQARIVSKSATRTEAATRAKAKALIGRIRLAASLVLAREHFAGVSMRSFAAGRTLGRSTARVASYLAAIRSSVELLDEHLAPYLGTTKASELVATALAELDAIQGGQEVGVATLPLSTREVNLAKGRLLSRIEELNKVARIAFWDRR